MKRLAPAGSSQRNECVNSVIGSKAPKIRHYGGSESSDFRSAAGVAQFNDGYEYVVKAAQEIGVADNLVTEKYVTKMNKKRERDSRRKASKAFKKARRNAKKTKYQKTRSLEKNEGVTYESGVALTQSEEDKVAITNGTLNDLRTTITDDEYNRYAQLTNVDESDHQVITLAATPTQRQLLFITMCTDKKTKDIFFY